MATAIALPPPVMGARQPPIYPLIVGNNGGYLAVRASPAQGSCGVSGYPCKHPGVDVNGKRGTIVRSPTNGVIVAIFNGASAPFSGYGPWGVVIRGDEDGLFHLLGHLDASTSSMGTINKRVRAGDAVGTVSSANHTHWEVRTRVSPNWSAGESNATNNRDPLAWLSGGGKLGTFLLLGGAAALLLYLASDL